MKHFLSILLAALAWVATSSNSYAGSCPDMTSVNNAPAYPIIKKERFHHWANRWLSAWYKPYHMVHDKLVANGDEATIVGKFDYDWTMHKDLEGEDIKVYLYGPGMSAWEYLGIYTTDRDGKIYVPAGIRDTGHYLVHMVVSGDRSSADGYLTVVDPETETVLFDIDGTLTINDFEAVGDYLGMSDATAYYYAPDMVNAYRNKGYYIAYLSARPYWLMKDTREWLDTQGIPLWHVHTDSNAELFEAHDAVAFKTDYINYLMDSGLTIIRAYGNAETDIEAYANAGIPKSETYIIGNNAGLDGTQTVDGDYSYHYSSVVLATENAK